MDIVYIFVKSKAAKSTSEKEVLVKWNAQMRMATPSNCGNVLSSYLYRPGVERSAQWHRGETRGYGKNQINRDNPQPSPKVAKTMDAVQRLNVGGLSLKSIR
jgi:hypothetical protein